eukprot:575544-Hanusia_phi.AAC.2
MKRGWEGRRWGRMWWGEQEARRPGQRRGQHSRERRMGKEAMKLGSRESPPSPWLRLISKSPTGDLNWP